MQFVLAKPLGLLYRLVVGNGADHKTRDKHMHTFRLYLSFAFLGIAIAALGACLGILLAVFA